MTSVKAAGSDPVQVVWIIDSDAETEQSSAVGVLDLELLAVVVTTKRNVVLLQRKRSGLQAIPKNVR